MAFAVFEINQPNTQGKPTVFDGFRPQVRKILESASAGLDPGGTFLEGFMVGFSTVPAAPDGVRPD